MKLELILNGLDCAHCAAEIEEKIQNLDEIQEAHVDFMSKKLTYVPASDKNLEGLKKNIVKIIVDMEPDVKVTEKGETVSLLFKGLDCAHCAAEIEEEICKISGVESCVVDFMSTTCTFTCQSTDLARVEQEIRKVVHLHEPDVVVETMTTNKKEEEQKDFKKALLRILIGAAIFIVGLFQPETSTLGIAIVLIAYLLLGYDVVLKAIRNILKGQLFDENFLMSLATIVAILIQDYREAVAVMLFYQVGEYFQERAVYSSRKSISDLMDIRPDIAHVIRDGETIDCAPEQVNIDDVVVVKPGERIPLDGIVKTGISSLDTSSLTGESLERDVEVGDEVLSGCVNLRGLLEITVTKPYSESTVTKILELVENTSSRKTKSENFITKFSKVYTPIVVVLAGIIAVGLPIVSPGISYSESIERACAFLVISCPCALVISIPLGFFAGIGGLSKNGILVKGSTVIENLSQIKQMVFDKTGTITKGKFGVSKIVGDPSAIEYAAYAESNSTHPIAKSILNAYDANLDMKRIKEVEEIAGHGIRILLDQDTILVGNAKLMDQFQIAYPVIDELGTLVYVAKNKEYMGTLVINDQLKEDSSRAIQMLKYAGVNNCVMLTGDRKAVAEHIAKEVGIDSVYSECLPDQKVNVVESLLPNGKLGFAGDGINDAPVLALADLGFAMGGVGSDAAIEAADVVIMDDNLTKIPLAINRSKKTMRIVNQNIVGALAVKLIVLALSGFGFVNMWLAIFADVGVSVIAILNSIRLLKK